MEGTSPKTPVTFRLPALAAVLAAAALVAGYGSSNAQLAAASPSATSNGLADQSPAQIVAAAQNALRSVNGFVVTGTLSGSGVSEHFEITSQTKTRIEAQITIGARMIQVIDLPAGSYLRASRAFWNSEKVTSKTAAFLASHWEKVPVAEGHQLTAALGDFTPNTLAKCLAENDGTLSHDGATTVNGQPAVVLKDAGNVPGGTPGTLAVASTGTPFPLRVTSTGPTRSGGKVDACNDGKGSDAVGAATLTDFGHPPAVVAPANPITLPSSASTSNGNAQFKDSLRGA